MSSVAAPLHFSSSTSTPISSSSSVFSAAAACPCAACTSASASAIAASSSSSSMGWVQSPALIQLIIAGLNSSGAMVFCNPISRGMSWLSKHSRISTGRPSKTSSGSRPPGAISILCSLVISFIACTSGTASPVSSSSSLPRSFTSSGFLQCAAT
eukprot:CAMPEP_0179001928 /NCGR_PEP_ID=MMETSP0795-20121207/11679_1 /TAXON_ID=88552 /ORGANISM="Amoebophrya sp., Strain Ameob2" /LENGTH=154 /DNA_ID=CAMNT_0020695449 /DNA_START=89 /DNA_END=553 /DNA_ORIENTATION=-